MHIYHQTPPPLRPLLPPKPPSTYARYKGEKTIYRHGRNGWLWIPTKYVKTGKKKQIHTQPFYKTLLLLDNVLLHSREESQAFNLFSLYRSIAKHHLGH